MKSVLVRYMKSQYAADFLSGNISMSSLSDYWNIETGKIHYDDWKFGKVTDADIKKAIEFREMRMQDMMEGGRLQIPNNQIPWNVRNYFKDRIIHDINYRIEAYGYCNLSCYFRVDFSSQRGDVHLDKSNIAYLASAAGINVSEKMLRNSSRLTKKVIRQIFPFFAFDNKKEYCVVQLPDNKMDRFGDVVVLIKNEQEFARRVINAVKEQGGECVIGDVIYSYMQDRLNPRTMKYRHYNISQFGNSKEECIDNGLFDLNKIIQQGKDIIHYGCLDKYSVFENQREWRICWLPNIYNHERKELRVGDLRDIAEIILVKEMRARLMEYYPESIPGFIDNCRRNIDGTISYSQFMDLVENIDYQCRLFFDIKL